MSDIIVIDACRKFGNAALTQFLESQLPDEVVLMQVEKTSGETFEAGTTIASIKDILNLPSLTELNNKDVVSVTSSTKSLKLTGFDILWYVGKPKRIAQLFGEETTPATSTKKAAPSDEKITVKSAAQDYDDYLDVDTFKGTMKECVTYINKRNALLTIRHFSMIPVFDINGSGWKTIEQLRKDGIVE